jgi:integrase
MATIRKIRTKWQVLIRKHNLKPIYKTFILKEDAVKWSRETEVKIEQGLYKDLTPARSTMLKEVLIQYRDTVSIHKKGYEIEKYKINKLSKYPISNNSIAELSALKLSEFKEYLMKNYSAGSVNKYLTLISIALTYAERILGIYIPNNPMRYIDRVKEPVFKGQIIEPEEEELLLKYAEQSKLIWLKGAIIMGIDCGVRRGELLKLKYSDIDFTRNTALLRDTKNGSNREIGLSQRAIQEIRKLPISISGEVFPIKRYDTFNFYFNQLQKKSGIYKRFHDCRHTFASRKTTQGWLITEIAAQGGWKQLQVLKRYTHIKAEYLAKKLK